MTGYVALLRAVNVGGTGKLPMADLATMATVLGFTGVRTYIASGNLLFRSDDGEAGVKAALEERLLAYAGKPVAVMVRSAAEMAAAAAANPFPEAPPNRTIAVFLDHEPPADLLDGIRHQTVERIAPGVREIYIAYGDAMADSRLALPAARAGTARNLNTVAKLAALAAAL